jgi:putative solute:sodium symporter small subunit
MANRSYAGSAGKADPAGVSGPSGSAAGGALPDVDWHGAAAGIAVRHWRRTLRLVAVLMAIGFVVTFVPQFWAREWDTMRFAGWPLPFYMGAQGTILIDIGLIVVYAWLQRRNDARYHRELHALRAAHRDSLDPDSGGTRTPAARATSPSVSSGTSSALSVSTASTASSTSSRVVSAPNSR